MGSNMWGRFYTPSRSSAFARHDLVLLALADAAQRVILTQRVTAEAVPCQDPAQVRVADEDDAVHVVNLALHPFRAGPDGAQAVDLQSGVALLDCLLVAHVLARRRVALRVEKDLEPEAVVRPGVDQPVVDGEAVSRAGVVEVVDAVEL